MDTSFMNKELKISELETIEFSIDKDGEKVEDGYTLSIEAFEDKPTKKLIISWHGALPKFLFGRKMAFVTISKADGGNVNKIQQKFNYKKGLYKNYKLIRIFDDSIDHHSKIKGLKKQSEKGNQNLHKKAHRVEDPRVVPDSINECQ